MSEKHISSTENVVGVAQSRLVVPLPCVQCGRETMNPARCQVCRYEDEINAGPALFRCIEHLAERDWFKAGTSGKVLSLLDADQVRIAVRKALGHRHNV